MAIMDCAKLEIIPPSSFLTSRNPVDPLPLPPELTSQIFVYAYLERLQKDGHWRRRSLPIELGWICRSWRGFAWSMPELWSTVVLRLGNTKGDKIDVIHLTLLREWLSRARSHKLEIYLETMDGVDFLQPPFETLHLLKEYHAQWGAIYLRIPAWWCKVLGGANTKLPFPNLRSILFDGDHLQTSAFGGPCPLDLTNAPLLTRLTLGNFALLDSNENLKLPLEQITHIDTTKIDLMQHLSLFPKLMEIRFKNVQPVRFGGQQPNIMHPKIRSLYLHFLHESDANRFLAVLFAPAVKTLGLDITGKSRDFMMDTISPFIDRSQCRLTHLYVRFNINDFGDEQDLIEFLATLPELKELRIRDPFRSSVGLSHIFFDVLSPFYISHQPYLPLLESLSYEGPLWLKPQDFLQPLILRATLHEDGVNGSDQVALVVLKKVRITADLYEDEEELHTPCSPLIHTFHTNLQDLVGRKVFELTNRDGTWWRL
ncbi:hypothetical protein GALMADRAFT_743601 [Galerina marginata CBS 339.88]|uniref:F-box domain-containing protein n=1 Tax=Galerina marginata (strain CBS 339.88) TaxID=685588 RepID=A0A067SPY0_GALM3|nr:hypothetical protein GALMADRAFT_743601 [Galerina marginata CBS 339.88]